MLMTYRGWRFTGAQHKSAENFGGREWWWVVTYRHEDGREAMGSAPSKEEAARLAREDVDRQEDPRPLTADQQARSESDIPW